MMKENVSRKIKEYTEQLSSRGSNYDIMKGQAQKEFLKYDQKKIIEKLDLVHDADYIYIKFVEHFYRISRTTGKVEWSEDDFVTVQEGDFHETLTILDVLCYSKEHACASGEFVNMKSLSAIQRSSSSTVGGGIFNEMERFFDHKDGLLSNACERLNGIKMTKGDVSYQIALFDFLPAMIQFWNSDDEFPASLEIFTDKNILQFMRYETVWYAVSHLLNRAREKMTQFTT